MSQGTTKPLFNAGNILLTPEVESFLKGEQISLKPYLDRHLQGDWGMLSGKFQKNNKLGLQQNTFVSSIYYYDVLRNQCLAIDTHINRFTIVSLSNSFALSS